MNIARGLRSAQARLWLLAAEAHNECFAMDPTTSDVVLARAPLPGAKRIFQIGYSNVLAMRAHLLRRGGFDVTSAAGNAVARLVLTADPAYDLFLVGHTGTDVVRTEMVRWLRAACPDIRIVALNSPDPLSGGPQYNVPSEPAAAWLSTISAAVALGADRSVNNARFAASVIADGPYD